MLKIFINPAAGKKKGIKIFEQAVASILKICDIRWDITGQPHAHQLHYRDRR